MKISFELNGQQFESHLSDGISIAIPMDFDGAQPNHFGAPKAASMTYEAGGFTGDTRRGGSCNVRTLTMVPHCNGTHTESIGHIVNEDVYIGHTTADALTTATLVTVRPHRWMDLKEDGTGESYRPPLVDADHVITADQLRRVLTTTGIDGTTSLILRTVSSLPKKSVAYGEENPPPFLTVQAMELIVARGYRHLLVDFPSVDRMYDEGLLTNHHLFWSVAEGTHQLNAGSRQDKTISEMVLVPEDLPDGLYLLNLQVPALCTDAAPSQPVLFRTRQA